jgi:hypothetical protein
MPAPQILLHEHEHASHLDKLSLKFSCLRARTSKLELKTYNLTGTILRKVHTMMAY